MDGSAVIQSPLETLAAKQEDHGEDRQEWCEEQRRHEGRGSLAAAPRNPA